MKNTHEVNVQGPRAVLVSVSDKQLSNDMVSEHLDELAFLAKTAGIDTIDIFSDQ